MTVLTIKKKKKILKSRWNGTKKHYDVKELNKPRSSALQKKLAHYFFPDEKNNWMCKSVFPRKLGVFLEAIFLAGKSHPGMPFPVHHTSMSSR